MNNDGEEKSTSQRKVDIKFGTASDDVKKSGFQWIQENPKKAVATAGVGYFLLKFFSFWLSPSKPASESQCKYCGSNAYGSGCPHSPDGMHVH